MNDVLLVKEAQSLYNFENELFEHFYLKKFAMFMCINIEVRIKMVLIV